MSEDLSREEVSSRLDRAVEELLDGAGISEPPVDALALAQDHLGLVIRVEDQQTQRRRPRRGAARQEILLQPGMSRESQQWTVAQAIGDHHKAELLELLGIPPEEKPALMGESLANQFARRLLVPTCWLANEARNTGYDLLELKKRFPAASHEVLAFRLLDLPAPCIITIVDNDHIYRRRSNAWPVRKQLSEPERQCQEYVQRYSRPHLVREQGWTVQGWPVHQADWKREILRSVVETEDS